VLLFGLQVVAIKMPRELLLSPQLLETFADEHKVSVVDSKFL